MNLQNARTDQFFFEKRVFVAINTRPTHSPKRKFLEGREKESQALKAIPNLRSAHHSFNSISDSGTRLPKVYVFLFYNFSEAK
jgi:hypothetical protein